MSRVGPGRLSSDQANEPAAATPATAFTLATGTVLFLVPHASIADTRVASGDNAEFFWDDANNRLGIGTNAPAVPLHIVGIIRTDANLTWRSGTSFLGTLDHVNTVDRTYTFQDSSDTIVGRATTDTLTNKTLLATGTGNAVTGILDRDVTTNDVVNTVTETTVYTFSVPANTLSTNRALRLTLIGDYLDNSGLGTNDLTIRVKYGATTIAAFQAGNTPNEVNRRALWASYVLSAANATNSQVGVGTMGMANTNTMIGGGGAISHQSIGGHNAIAEDSTTALNLVLTFQHSVADANISARALAVQVEVLR